MSQIFLSQQHVPCCCCGGRRNLPLRAIYSAQTRSVTSLTGYAASVVVARAFTDYVIEGGSLRAPVAGLRIVGTSLVWRTTQSTGRNRTRVHSIRPQQRDNKPLCHTCRVDKERLVSFLLVAYNISPGRFQAAKGTIPWANCTWDGTDGVESNGARGAKSYAVEISVKKCVCFGAQAIGGDSNHRQVRNRLGVCLYTVAFV